MIGKTLAHCEIESLLGKGGTREIFRAKPLEVLYVTQWAERVEGLLRQGQSRRSP